MANAGYLRYLHTCHLRNLRKTLRSLCNTEKLLIQISCFKFYIFFKFQTDEKIQRCLNLFWIRVLPSILKLEEILSVKELHICFKVLNTGYVFMCFNL